MNFLFFMLLSKDDESLRRWKEQLLGTVDFSAVGGSTSSSLSLSLSLSLSAVHLILELCSFPRKICRKM